MNQEHWHFRYQQLHPIRGKPVTFEEAEKHFLEKLQDPHEDLQQIRRELVLLYRTTSRTTDAMFYAQEYLVHATDLEARAEMYFFMGQAMEHADDFESAYRFYSIALELKPTNVFYRYFIHNNIGFSLIQLNRFVEAENYLREAIAIEPERLNGHKNLGLSLEGQGRYAEAARSFIAAVQANASAPRALRHLEELVVRYSEILAEVPDLNYHLNMCRQAVAFAANRKYGHN